MDDKTFSITGEAFSSVVLPDAHVDTATVLQEDPVGLGELWALVFVT